MKVYKWDDGTWAVGLDHHCCPLNIAGDVEEAEGISQESAAFLLGKFIEEAQDALDRLQDGEEYP